MDPYLILQLPVNPHVLDVSALTVEHSDAPRFKTAGLCS